MKWLALWLMLSWASAQEWSVQIAALSDVGTARAAQEQLGRLGYDAYVNTDISGEGQVTRVRVGCFTTSDGAQHFAEHLTHQLSQEAIAVPLGTGSPVKYCLSRDVGFILPSAWGVHSEGEHRITFWVELATRRYFISFDGGWQLVQTKAELASLRVKAASSLPELFGETYTGAERRVVFEWGEAAFVIAVGELIWQDGHEVIVLEEGALAAYRVAAR